MLTIFLVLVESFDVLTLGSVELRKIGDHTIIYVVLARSDIRSP